MPPASALAPISGRYASLIAGLRLQVVGVTTVPVPTASGQSGLLPSGSPPLAERRAALGSGDAAEHGRHGRASPWTLGHEQGGVAVRRLPARRRRAQPQRTGPAHG